MTTPCEPGTNDEFVPLIAALLGEPWSLPMDKVARLTLRQIVQLYHHPRDEYGRVKKIEEERSPWVIREDIPRGSDEEARIYFTSSKMFGQSRADSEARWLKRNGTLPTEAWFAALTENWR